MSYPGNAPACERALKDANRRWPFRLTASDGIRGDASHQQRKSDHNVGNAVDITHDADSGCTGDLIAAYAVQDARVSYVIWNRKINRMNNKGWTDYNGRDPHTTHCHISIKDASRDDTTTWGWVFESWGASDFHYLAYKPYPCYPGQILKRGAKGRFVEAIQSQMKARGWKGNVDGDFGQETYYAVKKIQTSYELPSDGTVDELTWAAIWSGNQGSLFITPVECELWQPMCFKFY